MLAIFHQKSFLFLPSVVKENKKEQERVSVDLLSLIAFLLAGRVYVLLDTHISPPHALVSVRGQSRVAGPPRDSNNEQGEEEEEKRTGKKKNNTNCHHLLGARAPCSAYLAGGDWAEIGHRDQSVE